MEGKHIVKFAENKDTSFRGFNYSELVVTSFVCSKNNYDKTKFNKCVLVSILS